MVEQLKRLTLVGKEKEGKQLNESHPFCAKIRTKTWKGKDIDFNKYDGTSDRKMHIKIFEKVACNHKNDKDIIVRLFLLSLGEEASEWFYSLENQSITSYG